MQETKTQYIVEIELCLNTKLNVMACPNNRQLPQQAVYSYEQDGKITMEQRWAFSFGDRSRRCADTEPVAYNVIHHN